jgi:hypothetical protein
VTKRPYGESEQDGAQCNSDHERPDQEAESALIGRFNHECSRIAPGDEITVNYNAKTAIPRLASTTPNGVSAF